MFCPLHASGPQKSHAPLFAILKLIFCWIFKMSVREVLLQGRCKEGAAGWRRERRGTGALWQCQGIGQVAKATEAEV